ncbi:XK-related protein 6 [Blattella germanica]|nr:XK-related protein 6 [Blattella germanica]
MLSFPIILQKLLCHVADIFLVVEYFSKGHIYWGVSTFLLIVLPAVIVQMFSMRWHILDETVTCNHWLTHIFLFGLLHRYILVLKTGLEARTSGDPTDFQRLYHQQNDICMLHLFESFMESAPQLVLQLYIMVSLEAWQSWTGEYLKFLYK